MSEFGADSDLRKMIEQTSKELVRGLFEFKGLSRVPFIPWVGSLAAQLEQITIEEMLCDPHLLSSSLLNAQQLFGYDAIVNVFDPSLEAEACGCGIDWGEGETLPSVVSHPLEERTSPESLDIADFDKRGRIPTVLEATRRIILTRGKEVAILGMVTGPLTLAKHLRGQALLTDLEEVPESSVRLVAAAGGIALSLCRKYSELGVDAIVIAEDMLGQINSAGFRALAGPMKSIWNVVRFYNLRLLLLSRGCSDQHLEPILDLHADGVALAGSINWGQLRDAAVSRKCCYGASIPTSTLLGHPSQVAGSVSTCLSAKGRGFFVSTEWDVPYSADVNTMHEVMDVVRSSR